MATILRRLRLEFDEGGASPGVQLIIIAGDEVRTSIAWHPTFESAIAELVGDLRAEFAHVVGDVSARPT